ncbi:osteopontin isoform X1 [Chelonia mydas]|uniref:osteopontin isoform X1 n=1 Tax=Chelonia mydas TaxID=8469 RepID=UPI00042BD6CF|nr:osteopontin isoform X1 [Chelonia mydas]
MKIAVLCLCLISIAFALPVSKSKHHAISESSEDNHDSRSHHSHRHHHQQVHTQSRVRPAKTQELLVPPQQSHFSSEESVENTEQQSLPKPASVSNEDDGDHDDNDSNDTDESDEDIVTYFPTEAPVTTPLTPAVPTRGDNSGRGDSVAYRMRAKAKLVDIYHKEKSSKLYKALGKFIVHDVTEEDDSTPDAESQQVDSSKAPCAACHFPGKFDMSMEWDDRSNIQDISEVNRRSHDKSMENGSQQQLDSVEADSDNSKPDVTEDSHMSNESTEQQQAQTEDLQQVDVVPEVNDSNQTAESTEDTQDHSSIEDNEVIL